MFQADQFVKASASGKLKVIVDQVRHLQEMAMQILQDAKDNTRLHHAACNFNKVPGQIYHLYKRPSGQIYFSMLSPEVNQQSIFKYSNKNNYDLRIGVRVALTTTKARIVWRATCPGQPWTHSRTRTPTWRSSRPWWEAKISTISCAAQTNYWTAGLHSCPLICKQPKLCTEWFLFFVMQTV